MICRGKPDDCGKLQIFLYSKVVIFGHFLMHFWIKKHHFWFYLGGVK